MQLAIMPPTRSEPPARVNPLRTLVERLRSFRQVQNTDPNDDDTAETRQYWQPIILLGGGIIVLLAGIIFHFADQHWKIYWMPYTYTFLREVGFAMIIAYFLTTGIEVASKRRNERNVSKHIEKIKENVFQAVYKTRQDAALIELVENQIFGRAFYRTNSEVIMTFEYIPSEAEMLRVDIKLRYRVKNTKDTNQTFLFRATIEKPYNIKLDHEAQIKFLQINNTQLTKEQLAEANDKLTDTPDFKRYEWEVEIPANSHANVKAEYTLVKHCRDQMVWQVFDPCDGLNLIVFHPRDIIIFGAALHATEGEKSGGGPEDQMFTIRIDRPLFPNNGAQLWWSRSEDVAREASLTPAKDILHETTEARGNAQKESITKT